MNEFLEQLDEAFSNVSFVDVSELRTLYYGRQNLFVSFSDSGEYEITGYELGELDHPRGVISHSMETVVAKKIGTSLFYANVFRYRGGSTSILDINSYSRDDYKSDIETLELLPHIDFIDLSDALDKVASNVRLRSYFDRLWHLTKELAGSGRQADASWAKILIDLGYHSLVDNVGKGVIVTNRSPVMLVLDTSNILEMDIVPVQKYRKDRRMNVIRRINKKNKRLWLTRNRIAKRKTDKYRDDGKSSVADTVADFRRLILGI